MILHFSETCFLYFVHPIHINEGRFNIRNPTKYNTLLFNSTINCILQNYHQVESTPFSNGSKKTELYKLHEGKL